MLRSVIYIYLDKISSIIIEAINLSNLFVSLN